MPVCIYHHPGQYDIYTLPKVLLASIPSLLVHPSIYAPFIYNLHTNLSQMMIISKANIKLIYQHLLAEGVLVVKKDARAPSHEVIPIPNLQVMKALQSLKSRGFVKEEFNWQYHYYFLTDEGIVFLRQYLHLPDSVVPATLVAKVGASSGRRGDDNGEERVERQGVSKKGEEGGEYRKGGAWRREAAQAATA